MSKLKIEKITIASREEADRALRQIGELEDGIAGRERDLNEHIEMLKEKYLVKGAGPLKKTLKRWSAALEKWATRSKGEFPEESKTLELNFGKVWFRWTPYRIEFDVSEETIIERLRARKMESCIRKPPEEVNLEALENYPDAVLKDVGAHRERDDKFYYEVKREEAK